MTVRRVQVCPIIWQALAAIWPFPARTQASMTMTMAASSPRSVRVRSIPRPRPAQRRRTRASVSSKGRRERLKPSGPCSHVDLNRRRQSKQGARMSSHGRLWARATSTAARLRPGSRGRIAARQMSSARRSGADDRHGRRRKSEKTTGGRGPPRSQRLRRAMVGPGRPAQAA
jgi:hypothetical protein